MDNLRSLRVFVEVVRCGSFVGAADRLQMSTSAVSRLVRELEQELGLSLLRRTTRRISLTDAGQRYFESCQHIVTAVDDLVLSAHQEVSAPQGILHVSAGAQFVRRHLAPALPGFLALYPTVKVHFHIDESPVELIAEGIDLALRMGSPQMGGATPAQGLVTRKLRDLQVWLVASPAFVSQHGAPRSVDEIGRFACLVDTIPAFQHRWPLGATIPVDGPVVANDGGVVAAMAEAGLGLALLPEFFVDDAVRDGRLVRLLAEQIDFGLELRAIFPGRHQITPAARAFVENLAQRWGSGL